MTRPDSARNFVPPPLLYAAGLLIGLAIDGQLGEWPPSAPAAARWAAVALIVAGLALIVAGLGKFRSAGTPPEPWAPATVLVTDGIYGLTRNPMYVGLTIAYLGLALLFRSPAAAMILAPLLAIMNFAIIPREEAYLGRRFGDAYAAYRRKARRWL